MCIACCTAYTWCGWCYTPPPQATKTIYLRVWQWLGMFSVEPQSKYEQKNPQAERYGV